VHHDLRHWVLLAQSFAQVVSHSVVFDQLIVARLSFIHTDIARVIIFFKTYLSWSASSDLKYLAIGYCVFIAHKVGHALIDHS
jgi:hypothetical protein